MFVAFHTHRVVSPRHTALGLAEARSLLHRGGEIMQASRVRAMMLSPLGKKTAGYSAALVLNALLGIAVYGLLTRLLPVEEFGTYSFIFALFVFSGMFFDFGFSPAGARLMAIAANEQQQRRTATVLLLASAILGIFYVLFIALASLVVDGLLHPGAGAVLLLVAPLTVVFPMQEMLMSMCQGSSRMALLSLLLIAPRLLLLFVLATVAASGITLTQITAATMVCIGVSVLAGSALMKPRLADVRRNAKTLIVEVREFGRELYLGRIVDGLTTGLDKILISVFHGMTPVGYYSIAMTMCSPIGMGSKALSQSAYRSFTNQVRIPTRILVTSLLLSLAGAMFILLAGSTLVPLFFTDSYHASLSVLPLLAVGAGLAGANHTFHSFLAARRQGRSLRILSIATSSVNVLLNLVLIPFLAMTGAALAFITTYLLNIVMNIHFYRKLVGSSAMHEGNGQ